MEALEIVLLLIGAIFVVLSFVIPVQKEEMSEETRALMEKEIENMVAKEMENVITHVDDVVDEAVEYSLEKTERALERLSNEKIMAVSEYSDTVLQEIHKNHEETIFLYDMLNDKHTNLKNTVIEVNKTVKEAAATKKQVEENAESKKAETEEQTLEKAVASANPVQTEVMPADAAESKSLYGQENSDMVMDISFVNDGTDDAGQNCNERILELHRQGKSKVAIAKELGLGVGEVKLVIDLYQNM